MNKRRRARSCGAFEQLESRALLAGAPIISEFMADNQRTLDDGAGRASDWIEIYNAGDAVLDLAGYHLTDDALAPTKWTFPSVTLARGAQLVVFASGNGMPDGQGNLHTNFQLDDAGEYLALVAPNGVTRLSEFTGATYPVQREDVGYGVSQSVTQTNLVAVGSSGKFLVPTAGDDAAIGSTWTGGQEPFADGAWQNVQVGVGYEGNAVETELRLTNIARAKVTTQSTNGFGLSGAQAVDGNYLNLTHTNTGDFAPWWEVNLGSDALLERINVFNRGDGCCPERHYNLTVEVRSAANVVLFTSTVFNPWNGATPATPPSPASNPFVVDLSGLPGGGIVGSKVRVAKAGFTGSEWLSIGEVEVLSRVETQIEGVNVALGKSVTPSGPLWPGLDNPQSLTDGNRATFSHPAAQVPTFHWTIDLGNTTAIDHIHVVNRGDGCCTERLSNYKVTVHTDDDGEFGPAVWTANVRTNNSNSGVGGVDVLTAGLDPTGTFAGRFLRIERNNTGAIDYWPQIAEVEVFPPVSYDGVIASDVEATMKNVNASAYLRLPFTVANASAYDALTLKIRDDDGFVAYLNGTEIARRNAPAGTPAFDATATARHFAEAFTEFAVPVHLLSSGGNVLAIHGLNLSAGEDDFLILPELVARSVTTGTIGYLPTPTPRAINGPVVQGFVADTQFDVHRGFFTAPQTVNITTATPGATLVYTTDGSLPTLTHGTQVLPASATTPPAATVSLTTTTVLRAAAFKTGFQPTNVDTQTYLYLADVIRQPTAPAGVPTVWNGFGADYEMDPDVVNNPAYSDEILAGLRGIPTMSLTIDPDDLWSTTDGIYIYPERLGIAYERPVSIEVINPDGTTFFQEDAGIRTWGTGWRPHSSTLKHSFQLKFKDIYGPTKLRHQLFPDAPVDAFDDIILRAQGSRGWTDFRSGGLEIEATQYIHDNWARDTALAMGKHEGHGTYVHLYLNGLYWGLYNPVERPTGNFGEEYFGGDSTDYDVLSHRTGEPVVANEGDLVAWGQVVSLSDGAIATQAVYDELVQLVDIDNLIDYMLVNQYATNHDGPDNGGNNMRALRKRDAAGRFQFYFWDMEYTFWNQAENRNITNVDFANTIGHLFTRLRGNAEFRHRFADRAVQHLTGDGALTPLKAAARWQARADQIYTAVIAESARWGDYRRPTQPYTRDVEWAAELNRLMTQYFPQRTAILINQLKSVDLYPDTPSPEFNQYGGVISPGFNLSMSVQTPPVVINTSLVAQGSPVQALVPTSSALGQTWTQLGFTPTGWLTPTNGLSGVGYDNTPTGINYNPSLGIDIGLATPSTAEPVSVYTRYPFDYSGNPAEVVALTLRMQYDDGFVAYLNGTEIARCLAPGAAGTCLVPAIPGTPPAFNAIAVGPFRTDTQSFATQDIDVTLHRGLLAVGPNVLAIHALNAAANSSDFLILPTLLAGVPDPGGMGVPIYYTLDGSDPRQTGGAVSPAATPYTTPITLNISTPVVARALQGTEWSAPTTVQFTVQQPLRITEVMYNPSPQSAAELARTPGGSVFYDNDDYEFIELLNVGTLSLDLAGMRFTDGIGFTFASQTLAPGEYAVVVRNQAAFENRYGTGRRVLGVYGGTIEDFGLANGGETVTLVDAGGGSIHSFTYDDNAPWHPTTDGDGPSLVIVDPQGPLTNWPDPAQWRPSFEPDGSPGQKDLMAGDVNEDNRVDLIDLAILQMHLGEPAGAARGDGDLTGDGAVTRLDALVLLKNYGRQYPSPAPSPAPSPSPTPASSHEHIPISTLAAPRRAPPLRRTSGTAKIDIVLERTPLTAVRRPQLPHDSRDATPNDLPNDLQPGPIPRRRPRAFGP